MYLYILTQATIKCAFLRYKKVILILWGNPNLFLDLKYHSLEHAETNKKYVFNLRKINGLVSTTLSLEQKSGF